MKRRSHPIPTRLRPARAGVLLLLCAAVAGGCGKEGPTDFDAISTLPATPVDLTAVVGDDRVELSWEVPDDGGIASYRVYRGTTGALMLVTTVSEARFSDENLVSGRRYFYQVSAVSSAGVEGRRSEILETKPDVYAIELQGGDEFTSTRRITAELSAPAGTAWMLLGNDSLFSGSSFRAMRALGDWLLTDGDGEKRVYARFRDTLGVVSETRSDAITLDTQAEILTFSVTEGVGGAAISSDKAYTPGETLFFSLSAGETDGSATVQLGQDLVNLFLRDDGSGGDRATGDGVYELRYVIPGGLSAQAASVTGDFFDRAGNAANPASAVGTLTLVPVSEAPPAVTLDSAVVVSGDAATLSWSASDAVDFASYRLFRGESPNVTDADQPVGGAITTRTSTLAVDEGLSENTTYYWRVYVADSEGFSTPSNEVSATTRNEPPAAVTLSSAVAQGERIRLSWEASTVADFAAYRVYRSTSEAVSESSAVLATISDRDEISYADEALLEATTYYYRVFVADEGGLTAGSNKLSATTPNLDPPAVSLAAPAFSPGGSFPIAPQNIILNWDASPITDFDRYEVFLSQSSPSPGCAGSVVATLRASGLASLTYAALNPGTYFFSVRVVDGGGLSACSNVVAAVVEQDTASVVIQTDSERP